MISLIVVNYRTAALTVAAVRSARAATTLPLEVVIVDNSVDVRETASLEGIADRLLAPADNLGYGGGANLGRRSCSGATIVIANPDVVFAPRSMDVLHDALSGAAVAGPALYWDSAHQWLLPPADVTTGTEKLDQVLATRAKSWLREWDRRRFRRRVAFWSLRETTPVRTLSGAVMAFRRDELERAGGFDERFRLYFEETDLLRRIGGLRGRIVYVPAAACRHLYNQSAAQVPAHAAARFAESELRYLEKWNGPFAARLLKRLERPMPAFDHPILDEPLHIEHDDVVVEASPSSGFSTAAGHFPRTDRVELPPEVLASATQPLFVRVVARRTGDVLATYKIRS